MNDKTKKTAGDGGEDGEERLARRRHWVRVRRRFVGAAAVFLLIGLLWQLGEDARAPRISPAPPPSAEPARVLPSAEIQAAAAELEQTEDIAAPYEEPPADDAPPPEETAEVAEEPAPDEFAEPGESAEFAPPAAETIAEESSDNKTAAETSAEDFAAAGADNQPPPAGDFAVQIAALSSEKAARRIQQKLREEKFHVLVSEFEFQGALLFRVRAVGYPSKAAAEVAKQKLQKLGYENPDVLDLR